MIPLRVRPKEVIGLVISKEYTHKPTALFLLDAPTKEDTRELLIEYATQQNFEEKTITKLKQLHKQLGNHQHTVAWEENIEGQKRWYKRQINALEAYDRWEQAHNRATTSPPQDLIKAEDRARIRSDKDGGLSFYKDQLVKIETDRSQIKKQEKVYKRFIVAFYHGFCKYLRKHNLIQPDCRNPTLFDFCTSIAERKQIPVYSSNGDILWPTQT